MLALKDRQKCLSFFVVLWYDTVELETIYLKKENGI